MAPVLPFRALRYHPRHAGEMGLLTAPPYDVIDEKDRVHYERAHPKNVVRLILPGEAGRVEDGSFYSGAAALLARWRAEGTLREDPQAAFYPYRQTYRGPDGEPASRLGFLGALSLEATGPGTGEAMAHERTLDAPRQDRTRLIAACRANLSPIFLIHPDGTGEAGEVLSAATGTEPLFQFVDRQGVEHGLWKIEDPGSVRRIQSALREDWALIADGHHRYESARLVMEQVPQEAGARQVLAYFCSLRDRGFRIFPIHRLILGEPEGVLAGLPDRLRRELGAVEAGGGAGTESLLVGLKSRGAGWVAVVVKGAAPLYLPLPAASAGGGAGSALDTTRLETGVLGPFLGLGPEAIAAGRIGFTADAGEACRRVESGEAAAALLLNPLRIDAVVEAARAGARLPQKSTYFYPKVFTGLAIRAF